ncbi:hypothetical protein P152DRAFT_482135 [Eremomyces bilateralis CBS 781.70]|uniref:DUF2428 domain-containing protein n=1 Tax=Eremomyces bilateralis CBS 781.70 TaxID=1392243 RepID=A0A6G1G3R7_9PEZI|nr:uncharacterized protein P152DRAFT_482135 [Eremomyces bilateralis CBS 781.70]KAF1812658.1 hypothetical protein P152DRAFT_482135 [Eremomyces bilateralis CBS 781.70]
MEFQSGLILRDGTVPEHLLLNFAKNVSRIIPDLDFPFSDPRELTIFKELEQTRDTCFQTAAALNITSTHRTAAYNALCALLGRCYAVDKDLGDSIATDGTLVGLFGLYLNRSDVAKAPAMRQLVTTLASLLQIRLEYRKGLVSNILGQVTVIVVKRQFPVRIKPALHILNLFLSKGLVSSTEVLTTASSLESIDLKADGQPHDPACALFGHILKCALFEDAATATGNFLTYLLGPKGITATWEAGAVPLWVYPLEKIIRDDPSTIGPLSTYAFPALARSGPERYLSALRYFGLDDLYGAGSLDSVDPARQSAFEILCKLLQVGIRMGAVEIFDSNEKSTPRLQNKVVRVPDKAFGALLPDSRPTVRVAALSILIVSSTVTRPLTKGSLLQLRRNWDHLADDPSPGFRGEFLALAQKLIDRVRAAAASMAKALRRDADISLLNRYKNHVRFVRSIIGYVETCISPDATYPRRITGLKLFHMLAKAGMYFPEYSSIRVHPELKWPCRNNIRYTLLLSGLRQLVQDPFADVRADSIFSLQILSDVLSREPRKGGPVFQLDHLVLTAEKIALASGRADHADGVARLYGLALQRCSAHEPMNYSAVEQILNAGDTLNSPDWWKSRFGIVDRLWNRLKDAIAILERSIHEAVEASPVHVTLASLQYVIRWMNMNKPLHSISEIERNWWHSRTLGIVDALERICSSVSDVVCNDAPEGHLPDSVEESLDTKDVLSFSWRAIKESSQLMSALVINTKLRGFSRLSDPEWLSLVETIGRLCQKQLLEIRHRGAFSSVSLALSDCCKQLALAGQQRILGDWYNQNFQKMDTRTSITRRSAGLPFIYVSLLSYGDDGLFSQGMKQLHVLACSKLTSNQAIDDSFSQVHALNCLRSIFTSSSLAERSEAYIEVGLQLATQVDARAWPIRNAALMLFQTLVDRLLGASDADGSGNSSTVMRFSYSRFPDILNTIIKIMEENVASTSSHDSEGLFAALHILDRAPPTGVNRQCIADLVESLSGSPNWHVRDMAARTYSRIVDIHDFELALERLNEVEICENMIEGRILCFQHLLKAPSFKRFDDCDMPRLSRTIGQSITKWLKAVKSPVTFASLFDSLLVLYETMLEAGQVQHFPDVYGELLITTSHLLQKPGDPSQAPFFQVAQEAGLKFALLAYRAGLPFGDKDRMEAFLFKSIQSVETDSQSTCVGFIRRLASFERLDPPGALEGICRVLAELILASSISEITEAAVYSLSTLLTPSSKPIPPRSPLTAAQSVALLDKTIKEQVRSKNSTRDISNAWLRLWGQLLGWCLEERLEVGHEMVHLKLLLGRIGLSLDDYNEPAERLAACQSIEGLQNFWTTVSETSLIVELLFAISDTLVDDDEDVRAEGATIATRLLRSKKMCSVHIGLMIPSMAHEVLVSFMGVECRWLPEFCGPAIMRMVGQRGGEAVLRQSDFPSIRQILEEEGHKTAELFHVEAQNLYIDRVCEAKRWSTVLDGMQIGAVDPGSALLLEEWVADSMKEMRRSELVARHSSSGLTPSFTTEVLLVGMQLFIAAATVIEWRRRERSMNQLRIPWKRDVEGSLRELYDWFMSTQCGHELWLEKIRESLRESLQ